MLKYAEIMSLSKVIKDSIETHMHMLTLDWGEHFTMSLRNTIIHTFNLKHICLANGVNHIIYIVHVRFRRWWKVEKFLQTLCQCT